MDNLVQHASNQPVLLAMFILSCVIIVVTLPYFIKQHKLYGSAFEFASQSKKVISGLACLAVVGLVIYGSSTYVSPPSAQIAIVLGNTQNTPNPGISQDISDEISGTMLEHRGDNVDKLADSIKIISAVKHPEVITLDASTLKFKEIGNNSSNAKRSALANVQVLKKKIEGLQPTDNGANYLEAILEAKDNVVTGSRILVLGSGLSDSGVLNFSKTNLLTNETTRKDTISSIREQYGSSPLKGYQIDFYGLGDTTAPQETLSSIQKGIVRSIYRDIVQKLGGDVNVDTKTQSGAATLTSYVVGTTDTGCGDINLVFDDNDLKFIGDQATFVDKSTAIKALSTIKDLWIKQSDTIKSIQVDGYIAHHPTADNLSQERADSVKQALTDLGVPSDKITATGRGFGPYDLDAQNRAVKVTISRNSEQCNN